MSAKELLISVIMPSYNTPVEYLSLAVDSILSQTYENFEFIIIDDCSTDESVDYLASITDPRVRVIRNDVNRGITASLNVALDNARGDYIARMDSDDISLPERFEKQIAFMEANPDVIVCGTWIQSFGGADYIQKRIIPKREYHKCSMLFGNIYGLTHPTAMFRGSAIRENNIRYDETLPTAQDYGMWVECVNHGRIANVQEVLLNYRVHSGQISSTKRALQDECAFLTMKKQLGSLIYSIDDETAKKHFYICRDPYISQETAKWFRALCKANEKKGTYDKKTFNKFVKDFLREKAVNSAKVTSGKTLLKTMFSTPVRLHGVVYKTLWQRLTRKK